jgi:hypothetical protein
MSTAVKTTDGNAEYPNHLTGGINVIFKLLLLPFSLISESSVINEQSLNSK